MTDQTDVTSADDRPAEPLLTLTEASIVTGRPPEAIRTMIRRRKLAARKGNDGKWLVEIPVDMKRPVGQDHGQAASRDNTPNRVAKRGQNGVDRSVSLMVEQATTRLTELEAVASELRFDAEHWRDRAEQEALARARAEGKLEAFERAHAAEISAKDALVVELRALLDDARRPWWRRWLDQGVSR
jgi:hypothetical protein